MAASCSAAAVSPQELEKAEEQFQDALDCMFDDTERAVNLLGEVLQTRAGHYGAEALECAETYYQYGVALLLSAQAQGDVFGNKVKQIEKDKGGEDDAEEEEEEEEVEEGAEPVAADDKGKGKAPAAAAEGGQAGGSGSEEEDEDEDGQAEDADDMGLAWEMLETARAIYLTAGEASHASELADVHLALGNHRCEAGMFDDGIAEYERSLALLGQLTPEDRRRGAEVHFKLAVALQYADQLPGALDHCQRALVKLDLVRAGVEARAKELAAAGDGHGQRKAERELGGLDDVMGELRDRKDDLQAQLAARDSLKAQVMAAMGLAPAPTPAMAAANLPAAEAGAAGKPAAAGPAAAAEATFSAPSQPGAVVQDLGVVGRGKQRITLAAMPPAPNAPAAAAAGGGNDPFKAAAAAATSAAATPPKRSLESLMGGGPAGSGVTTVGFGAAAADAGATVDPTAKRLKPVPAKAEAAKQ